jgi:hypothetical protein
MATATRLGKSVFYGIIGVIALGFLGALAFPFFQSDKVRPGREFADRPIGNTLHPVTIREPDSKPWIDSGKTDERGNPIKVTCATCHDTRDPGIATNDAAQLDEFHQGLKYAHGGQTCLSCHNANDYNTLKRADGQALDFSQSMQLCAQCHGPQFRDYQNGSHGGMTGHWDLKQGPRQRNHCTDCHDPHHPAYPKVMPVFPPKPVLGETILKPHDRGNH